MSEFAFETITAVEALGITAHDVITVGRGSAMQTTVIYGETSYDVTIGDRTVTFGNGLPGIADGSGRNFVFPDGSALFVGDRLDDRPFLPLNAKVPQNGAAYGGMGNDILTIGEGSWLVQGNQGEDLIRIGNTDRGNATVYGGQGNDNVAIERGGTNFVQGNKGDDVIQALGVANTLLGGQGNDTITSGGVADFVNGNLGDDKLTGTGTLLGEGGNDTVNGGYRASSTLRGGDGADQITLQGDAGFGFASFAYGDEGDDRIVANGFRHDELFGGGGNDTITSVNNPSNVGDLLDGGDGNDSLAGGEGSDTLTGGAGGDTLNGGHFGDKLTGGLGADVFVITDVIGGRGPVQDDQILDWSAEDKIKLAQPLTGKYVETTAANFSDGIVLADNMLDDRSIAVVAVQIGADVYLCIGNGQGSFDTGAFLIGRSLNDISEANFV